MKRIITLLLSIFVIFSSFVFPQSVMAETPISFATPLPTDGVESYSTKGGKIEVGQVIQGAYSTGYCACSICNGSYAKSGYTTTASGMKLSAGMKEPYVVANNYYPLGTILMFNGIIYTVADRGAGKYFDNLTHLDIFVTGTHIECSSNKYNQNGTITILYLPSKSKKFTSSVDYNSGAKIITTNTVGNKTNFYKEVNNLAYFAKTITHKSTDEVKFDGDVQKILDEINATYTPTFNVGGGGGGSGLGYGEYNGYFERTPSGSYLTSVPKGSGLFISPLPKSFTYISGGFPTYSSGRSHSGIDMPCPEGTAVCAAADGVVTKAGDGSNYGTGMWTYGKLVEIRHANGYVTRYGHNSQIKVFAGQQVKQGDLIALSGNTGNSSGPHCHFQVRLNGTNVNPTAFM